MIELTKSRRARIYKAWSSGARVDKICQRFKINPEQLSELRIRYGWDELVTEERLALRNAFKEEIKSSAASLIDILATVIANYKIKADTMTIETPEVAQLNQTVATFQKLLGKSIDDADLSLDKIMKAMDKIRKDNKDILDGKSASSTAKLALETFLKKEVKS